MANDLNQTKQQQSAALLALGVSGRLESDYPKPTDEELAQLIENSLDMTRRQQLMHIIANDPDTHKRWMALVDTASTLGIGAFAENTVETASPEANRKSFLAPIIEFFQNPFAGMATAGGGFATAAAVLFLVFSGQPEYQKNIDGLYSDFGDSWQSMPAPRISKRGVTPATQVELSAYDQALQDGMLEGLQLLGPEFFLQGLDVQQEQLQGNQGLENDQYAALKLSGKAAAISHFKCHLESEDDYFVRAMLSLEGLQPELAKQLDGTSTALQRTIARKGSARDRVCRFSRVVVDRLSK